MITASLADALRAGPVVLDGGLGTWLDSAGHDVSSPLWSAQALLDAPEQVLAAHAAFFHAGAQVAVSASYQASYDGLAAAGVDRGGAERLLVESVRIAQRAREDASGDGAPRWVAASVGPYGASRADGSEYRGDDDLSVDELADWHRPRLDVLARSGADVLAIETLPSLREVLAVVRALEGSPIPAWIAVTPQADRTRAGDDLGETFAAAAAAPEVVAVGVNCCSPADVLPSIRAARRVTDLPIVAYPNSGERWDAARRSWSGDAAFPDELVRDWLDAGASAVGGCCRIGPPAISRIAAAVGAPAGTPS